MSVHLIQRRLETQVSAFLATEITGLPAVLPTEDFGLPLLPQNIQVTCADAQGSAELPANYACKVTVELRTNLSLYPDRAAAVAGHFVQWGTLADAMMQDDLATSLATADLGINGIEDAHVLSQGNAGGTLTNSITRIIHAVAHSLTA